MIKVLFVCLGNICRSPLAMGLFRQQVERRGLSHLFEIDSAATSHYEVGNKPDHRTIANARRNGLELDHCARQLTVEDYHYFDHILVMDRSNLKDVLALLARHALDPGKVQLLREYDPEPGDRLVPDPYYGGPEGFELVYTLLSRTTAALLEALLEQYGLAEYPRQEAQ